MFGDLLAFLRLDGGADTAGRAARIVAEGEHLTRHVLEWPGDTFEGVRAPTQTHASLRGYRFDAPPAARARPASQPAGTLDHVHAITAIGVASDLPLPSHWLDHYSGLGVPPRRMHVILNAEAADDPGIAAAQDVLSRRGCADPVIRAGTYSSREM